MLVESASVGLKLVDLVADIGRTLGFDVATEVEASESAWVDVVWFDRRFAFDHLGIKKPRMRWSPVMPVAGFEIEVKTGLNAKHIKGSVSNLNVLAAALGVIVIGRGNIDAAKASIKAFSTKSPQDVERLLMSKVYRWVYAEAQPRGRVVIMSEGDVVAWAARLGVPIPSMAGLGLTGAAPDGAV